MDSMIIICDQEVNLASRVPPGCSVRVDEFRLVIERGEEYAFLDRLGSDLDEWDDAEQERIRTVVERPVAHALTCRDVGFCRELVMALADDATVLVENWFKLALPGRDFVAWMRSVPAWDWRREKTEPRFERVYTVTDYYDGPRGGVADFRGEPHQYRSVYLDSATWNHDEDRFELQPLSSEAFKLALEDWAVWRRWENARYAGMTDDSTHPALPEDRARHQVVEAAFARELAATADRRLIVRGDFRSVDRPADLPDGALSTMEVCWFDVQLPNRAPGALP